MNTLHHTEHAMTAPQGPIVDTMPGLHTVLGANGVIARELSLELGRKGLPVRQVSRHPRAVKPTDQLLAADLLDAKAVSGAVAGSDVVYLVAGLPYDTTTWEVQWPVLMRHVIDACARHGARLVFFDNVYAYGWVKGAMTEETPFNPCSRKGEVRAAVASQLLNAMAKGGVNALIARSADFYGPGAVNSFLRVALFDRLRAGKAPQWIGNPRALHSFTYTPDAGRVLALLGQTESAYGQTWHLPTCKEDITGEGFVRLACEQARQTFRLQVLPNWLLKPLGWVAPPIRENIEMMYQLQFDYRFDSSKIARALGVMATAYPKGIDATLAAQLVSDH
ncbi:NAD-dependent epimerase/dehydratase family protein [Hydrogenophaga sp. PAMC20947]|uniref:NAD-dependent epimerase/dehydratase family protein n=1 Tax=Hydrogenophaga sp. PAMC20947 TaxID=2565558 RepID=UPI001445F090|nr:NAD-dependent epimerase/dehydratase family protein [Hydrogenophaga sp. PAMC20947]